MIAHIVLLQPRTKLGDDDARAMIARIQSLVTSCPSVRGCRLGRRVQHGSPGYEAAMRTDYSYALVLEFADMDGLHAYLAHPAHADVAQFFTTAAAALAYDYELADVRDAHRLI